MWDSRFDFEDVAGQLTVPKDKKMIEDLGVEQSLDAIQSNSLWAASLAAESKKLISSFGETRRLTSLRIWSCWIKYTRP
jgi:hypothetical protein